MFAHRFGARVFVSLAMAAIVIVGLVPPTHPVAAASTTKAQAIIGVARAQLGDPYRFGATGPSAFDCSGLVIYAYTKAGYAGVIRAGNPGYRSARSLYLLFKSKGLATRSSPQPGDLVVWGDGKHIGIYLGSGYAISTLTSGVRIHTVASFSLPLTAYLHTGMNVPVAAPVAVLAPAPQLVGVITVAR